MNRPFGAVDVAANLKGAVPKSTTQKILATLAEKGEITQKPYGEPGLYGFWYMFSVMNEDCTKTQGRLCFTSRSNQI